MGLVLPIGAVLIALEAMIVVMSIFISWIRRASTAREIRVFWRRCLMLTSVLAAFPTLVSLVEIGGDLVHGFVSMKPLLFLVVALLFPALVLIRVLERNDRAQ